MRLNDKETAPDGKGVSTWEVRGRVEAARAPARRGAANRPTTPPPPPQAMAERVRDVARAAKRRPRDAAPTEARNAAQAARAAATLGGAAAADAARAGGDAVRDAGQAVADAGRRARDSAADAARGAAAQASAAVDAARGKAAAAAHATGDALEPEPQTPPPRAPTAWARAKRFFSSPSKGARLAAPPGTPPSNTADVIAAQGRAAEARERRGGFAGEAALAAADAANEGAETTGGLDDVRQAVVGGGIHASYRR